MCWGKGDTKPVGLVNQWLDQHQELAKWEPMPDTAWTTSNQGLSRYLYLSSNPLNLRRKFILLSLCFGLVMLISVLHYKIIYICIYMLNYKLSKLWTFIGKLNVIFIKQNTLSMFNLSYGRKHQRYWTKISLDIIKEKEI